MIYREDTKPLSSTPQNQAHHFTKCWLTPLQGTVITSVHIATVYITQSRSLYWSDVGSNPKIKKASMDGSGDRTIVPIYNTSSFVFTLDYDQQVLYWTNGSNLCYYINSIERSNDDESGIKMFHNTSRLGSCFSSYYYRSQAIDFFRGAVYSYSRYISKTVVEDTPTIYRYDCVSYYRCYSSHTGMKVISDQRQVQGVYVHN